MFILDLYGSSVIYSKRINKSTALLFPLRVGPKIVFCAEVKARPD